MIDHGMRYLVRYLYDVQRLRIATTNRPAPKGDNAPICISAEDAAMLENLGGGLQYLEAEALKRIKKKLKNIAVYEWMSKQKGCGPTMSAVLISEVDISRCNTVSSLWHFCGLSVNAEENKAVRRKKGERITYNPLLKDKMLKVLADSFIKCNSPWRKFYDDYKHRKKNTRVEKCMGCTGKTEAIRKACVNCQGTGGPAPWGASDLHRDKASRRYMIKMFLQRLWVVWRELEGLDTREPYCVQYLGIVHHA